MNIDVPSIVQSILAAAITLLACGVAGAGLLYLVRSALNHQITHPPKPHYLQDGERHVYNYPHAR